MKRRRANCRLLLTMFCAHCGAGTTDAADRACIPGAQVTCGCPNGRSSVQICNEAGTGLNACNCAGALPEAGSAVMGSAGGFGGSPLAAGGAYGTAGFGGSQWFASGGSPQGGAIARGVGGAASVGSGAPPGAVVSTDAGGDDSGILGACTTSQLPYEILDADYSDALDRIVLATTTPNQVVVVNPATLAAVEVSIPLPPGSISVSPDGLTAAVAHTAYVSIINLSTGTLTKTIPTTCDTGDIVLAGNGYAYVFPRSDQWVDIHSVEIATAVDHGTADGWSIYAGTKAKLHPGGTTIYGIDIALSPTDIERYDIGAGVAKANGDSPYHGDYPICRDIWMSRDQKRIFTGCGTVFRSAPGTADDMTYGGTLGGAATTTSNQFRAVVHDGVNNLIYAIPSTSSYYSGSAMTPGLEETQVRVYAYEYLTLQGSKTIPCVDSPNGKVRTYGRFVFSSSKGDGVYVLVQADPKAGMLHDWGIARLQ